MRQHTLEVVMTGHGRGKVILDGVEVQAQAVGFRAAIQEVNVAEITLSVERAHIKGPAHLVRGAPSYFEFNARRGKRR